MWRHFLHLSIVNIFVYNGPLCLKIISEQNKTFDYNLLYISHCTQLTNTTNVHTFVPKLNRTYLIHSTQFNSHLSLTYSPLSQLTQQTKQKKPSIQHNSYNLFKTIDAHTITYLTNYSSEESIHSIRLLYFWYIPCPPALVYILYYNINVILSMFHKKIIGKSVILPYIANILFFIISCHVSFLLKPSFLKSIFC